MRTFAALSAVVLVVLIASSEAKPSRNVNVNTNTNTNQNYDSIYSSLFNSVFSQLIEKGIPKTAASVAAANDIPVPASDAAKDQHSADQSASDAPAEPSIILANEAEPIQDAPQADTPTSEVSPAQIKMLKTMIAAKAREIMKSKQQ